jgi:DNA-binding transcriptional MerR regulator
MQLHETTENAWTDERLSALEAAHPEGLAVQEIVDAFGSKGDRLSEATFRKYVQLGLLPRSVRVGRKGKPSATTTKSELKSGSKNRGSQGLYPATVVRRIETIRRLMAQGYTIEEIQKEFLFIRGDIEELSRSLKRVYGALDRVTSTRGGDELARRKCDEAKRLGELLLRTLDEIEQRASLKARLARAQV